MKRISKRQAEINEMIEAAKEEAYYNRLAEIDKANADFYANEEQLTGEAEHLRDSVCSSETEIDADDAHLTGRSRPESEWILSDRDVWYRNPYFTGIRTNRHPEDEHDF